MVITGASGAFKIEWGPHDGVKSRRSPCMMAAALVLVLIAVGGKSMIGQFSAFYTKSGPLTKQLHPLPIWLQQ